MLSETITIYLHLHILYPSSHRTLETEGIIIAREHSTAGSAIIFLLVTVLFCYEEPNDYRRSAMVSTALLCALVPYLQCLGVNKKCVR